VEVCPLFSGIASETELGETITGEKIKLPLNAFSNVKTELLPLLVIIDFPYGELVKTIMFKR
jgi:hypothetical protein